MHEGWNGVARILWLIRARELSYPWMPGEKTSKIAATRLMGKESLSCVEIVTAAVIVVAPLPWRLPLSTMSIPLRRAVELLLETWLLPVPIAIKLKVILCWLALATRAFLCRGMGNGNCANQGALYLWALG